MSVNNDLPASRSTTKVTEYDLLFILAVKFSLYLFGLNEIYMLICAYSSTVVALLVYILVFIPVKLIVTQCQVFTILTRVDCQELFITDEFMRILFPQAE